MAPKRWTIISSRRVLSSRASDWLLWRKRDFEPRFCVRDCLTLEADDSSIWKARYREYEHDQSMDLC